MSSRGYGQGQTFNAYGANSNPGAGWNTSTSYGPGTMGGGSSYPGGGMAGGMGQAGGYFGGTQNPNMQNAGNPYAAAGARLMSPIGGGPGVPGGTMTDLGATLGKQPQIASGMLTVGPNGQPLNGGGYTNGSYLGGGMPQNPWIGRGAGGMRPPLYGDPNMGLGGQGNTGGFVPPPGGWLGGNTPPPVTGRPITGGPDGSINRSPMGRPTASQPLPIIATGPRGSDGNPTVTFDDVDRYQRQMMGM